MKIAASILNSYWDLTLPVDIHTIVEKLGIRLYFTEHVDESRAYFNAAGERSIAVNSSLSPQRQRYVIAHELGHHQLGHVVLRGDYCDYYGNIPALEDDAHEFARQLMIPDIALEAVIVNKVEVEKMVNVFDIEVTKITRRILNS